MFVLKVVLVKREFIGDSQQILSRNMKPTDVKKYQLSIEPKLEIRNNICCVVWGSQFCPGLEQYDWPKMAPSKSLFEIRNLKIASQ